MDDMGSGAGRRPEDDDRLVVQEQVTVSLREARRLDRQARWSAHNWGWVFGVGAVAAVLGIVIFSHAFGSLHALIWLSGLFLLFLGVAQVLTIGRGGDRRTHLLGAIITAVGGIVLLVWPGETLRVVAVVAGITVLAWGGVRGWAALHEAHETRTHDLAVSIALVVLGIVMIVWPKGTITIVGLLIGGAAIIWGVVMMASALRLRRSGKRWLQLHARSRRTE
jgi:uncharacterized membrane protein HdeD (DUF308 family)